MELEEQYKGSSTKKVFCQIKRQILEGGLTPGEKLPSERNISEMLGVSRTCIREAINALAFSGYLEVIQGKGTFVTETQPRYDELFEKLNKIADFTLTDVMEVRILLEGSFARLAAIRATKKDIKKIEERFKDLEMAENTKTHFIKDLEFHIAIAEATQNPIMKNIMHIAGEKFHYETAKLVALSSKTRKKSIGIIQKIVEAIKNKEPTKAQNYMVEHLKDVEISFKEEKLK